MIIENERLEQWPRLRVEALDDDTGSIEPNKKRRLGGKKQIGGGESGNTSSRKHEAKNQADWNSVWEFWLAGVIRSDRTLSSMHFLARFSNDYKWTYLTLKYSFLSYSITYVQTVRLSQKKKQINKS